MPYHSRQSLVVSHHAAVDAATPSQRMHATIDSRRVVTDTAGVSRLGARVVVMVMLLKVRIARARASVFSLILLRLARDGVWAGWLSRLAHDARARCIPGLVSVSRSLVLSGRCRISGRGRCAYPAVMDDRRIGPVSRRSCSSMSKARPRCSTGSATRRGGVGAQPARRGARARRGLWRERGEVDGRRVPAHVLVASPGGRRSRWRHSVPWPVRRRGSGSGSTPAK